MDALTPREIVQELDKYIVGQDNAKRAVAIALRNRWRRQQLPPELRDEVAPKNIIMIGPTGVGKTEIARRLATLARSHFSRSKPQNSPKSATLVAMWSRWCVISWNSAKTWCSRKRWSASEHAPPRSPRSACWTCCCRILPSALGGGADDAG